MGLTGPVPSSIKGNTLRAAQGTGGSVLATFGCVVTGHLFSVAKAAQIASAGHHSIY